MNVRLTETTPLGEASVGPSGRMKVHAITAGLGSSGYYSPEVLKEAASNRLIAKGTPLFLDHASETERIDRPERSVRDIAAVFTDAATYDDKAQALVGEIQVFAPYRDLLTEMAPHIGLSISGSATDITEGNIDGKRVPVIEGLARIDSVDWVTRAGRGGKVVQLLESARFVREATASDRAQQLSDAVLAAYSGPNTYAWVQDQDAEANTVWFTVSTDGPAPSCTYEQTYDVGANDVDITLTGTPIEVRRLTKYVPVNTDPAGPASPSTPTTETQEVTMGNIQVDEAEHRRVTEAAGRVPTLESERDTAAQERDAARAELALVKRTDAARGIVAEKAKAAGVTFTALEERGLLADLPVAEDGTLDATNFGQAVDAAVTEATARQNTGSGIKGFGESAGTQEVGESRRPTANAWGRALQIGA